MRSNLTHVYSKHVSTPLSFCSTGLTRPSAWPGAALSLKAGARERGTYLRRNAYSEGSPMTPGEPLPSKRAACEDGRRGPGGREKFPSRRPQITASVALPREADKANRLSPPSGPGAPRLLTGRRSSHASSSASASSHFPAGRETPRSGARRSHLLNRRRPSPAREGGRQGRKEGSRSSAYLLCGSSPATAAASAPSCPRRRHWFVRLTSRGPVPSFLKLQVPADTAGKAERDSARYSGKGGWSRTALLPSHVMRCPLGVVGGCGCTQRN